MSTDYYVENIERITEQMLEEEVLEETEQIRTEGINEITSVKNDALNFIIEQKRELIQAFSELDGIRSELNQIDSDTNAIYEKILVVADETEEEIENDLRAMIVENGYKIQTSDDNDGNVTITIAEVM